MVKTTNKPRVVLPPFGAVQQLVRDDAHRFKVLVAGRRFGKSTLALFTCIDLAVNEGKIVWFVSPTFNNVMTHWRTAKRMLGELPSYKNEQQKYMEFEHGDKRGSLTFKSGDRPENLRGDGLDYVVVDEAAYQDAEVWNAVLRPALSDRKGGALLISTPNGVANWFYSAYMAGQDTARIDWMSWRYRSVDSPFMPAGEVEAASQDMPELKFQQEYLAEFISDAGGVFRNIENQAVLTPLSGPVYGNIYRAGIDWGRKNDFTVISVWDQNGDQVFIDRFNQIGWSVQIERVKTIYEKWGITKFVTEANSVGSANIEAMQKEGLPVEPVYMTNVIKTGLVERFAGNLERGRVRMLSPDNPIGNQQIGEMQSYSIERTKGGMNVTYNAPPGWHDDLVIGAILGASHISSGSTHAITISENPFYKGKPPEVIAIGLTYAEQQEAKRIGKIPPETINDLDSLLDFEMLRYKLTVGSIYDEPALRKKLRKELIRKLANA